MEIKVANRFVLFLSYISILLINIEFTITRSYYTIIKKYKIYELYIVSYRVRVYRAILLRRYIVIELLFSE